MAQRACLPDIRLKRAYEPASPADGLRILVDRFWPRGLTRSKARIDVWMKGITPSNELRRWFGHDPTRWSEFRKKYKSELAMKSDEMEQLRALAKKGRITLVYGAKDEVHNHAKVLMDAVTQGVD